MAQRAGSKNELIKCEYCGEMYAASYKHCPFCNEDGTGRWNVADDEEDEVVSGGGKRLASGGGKRGGYASGGGQGPSVRRVISMVVSLALIIAAAGIVISIVRSLVGEKDPVADATPTPAQSSSVSAAPSAAVPSDPVVEPTPITSQPPIPVVTSPVAELTAPTSFKLNRKDFTLDHAGETFQMKITYTPENARGDVTWKSSNPNVASVSWNGVVTAVSQGTVTLTATVAGVGDKTCIVRCNFKDSSGSSSTTTTTATQAPSSSGGSSSASGLKLSRDDFTLDLNSDNPSDKSWRLTVSGTGSAVTWASSNTGVATVSADGTVKAVGKGTADITATVDGVSLKCIVRVRG